MSDKSQVQNPWTKEVEDKYEGKPQSKFYDPCQELANKSIKCLHRNPGNKDLCNDYFQAYRDCKKEWQEARRTSWFKGDSGS